MSEASIVGWSHSPFGKLEEPDVEALIGRVAAAAIEDAGLQPLEVDAVFVGNFNAGFSRQDFPSSLPMLSVPDLRFKAKGHPVGATRVSMHVITAMQLAGEAGAMPLPRADVGGVFNMGGAAVANHVSILERAH